MDDNGTQGCPFSRKAPSDDRGKLTDNDIGNWILKSQTSYSVEQTPEWQAKRKEYKSTKNAKNMLLKNILRDTESFNRRKTSSAINRQRMGVKDRIEKVSNWKCELPVSSNCSERGSSRLSGRNSPDVRNRLQRQSHKNTPTPSEKSENFKLEINFANVRIPIENEKAKEALAQKQREKSASPPPLPPVEEKIESGSAITLSSASTKYSSSSSRKDITSVSSGSKQKSKSSSSSSSPISDSGTSTRSKPEEQPEKPANSRNTSIDDLENLRQKALSSLAKQKPNTPPTSSSPPNKQTPAPVVYQKPPTAKEVYKDDLELRICKLLIAKEELRQKQEDVSDHIIRNTSYYRETGDIWLKLARRNHRKAKFRIIQLIALVLRKLSEKKNLKSLVEVYCHLHIKEIIELYAREKYVGRKEKKNLNNILDYLLNKKIVAEKYIEEFRQWFLIAYETKKKIYFQAKAERIADGGTGTTMSTNSQSMGTSSVETVEISDDDDEDEDKTPSVGRVIMVKAKAKKTRKRDENILEVKANKKKKKNKSRSVRTVRTYPELDPENYERSPSPESRESSSRARKKKRKRSNDSRK